MMIQSEARNKARNKAISRGEFSSAFLKLPARQAGAILLITLMVLVAMTLSALALIRSVNMTHLIAGNLAFRESALLSSEHSTEVAFKWLVENNDSLYQENKSAGYQAKRADPTGNDWNAFWNTLLEDNQVVTIKSDGKDVVQGVVRNEQDAAGNTVSYVIHRLCNMEGAPFSEKVHCSKPPAGNSGDSAIGGEMPFPSKTQIYYRITSRVSGPRNTVVYTQTIIAI
jgi:Tfp pilus assembly protein PilX